MKFNIESIVVLEKLLKQNTFDEKEFNRFVRTKGIKGFLEHERSMNKYTSINDVRKEIKRITKSKEYKDRYGFHKIKDNILQLSEDIQYIKEKEKFIIDEAIEAVYKIVPRDMSIDTNIYLYVGGDDGGFTVNRNRIYINYGKYIGNVDEFIKIISHELYHSRNIQLRDRFIFLLETLLSPNGITHEIMSKIIEEGIACLVQHGPILKADDPTGTLTQRGLLLLKGEFELLNQIILKGQDGIQNKKSMERLNIYIIGYHIITTVYNGEGVLILDDWTRKLKYRRIIETYIEICNRNSIPSGFSCEAKDILINTREGFRAR